MKIFQIVMSKLHFNQKVFSQKVFWFAKYT